MTVRTAELAMAVVMALFSIYLMVKSAELPIGWISGEGPGGGAWPFWLSAVMLGACLWIIIQWFRGKSKLARSREVYIEPAVAIDVGLVAAALVITVALFYVIGVYGAVPLFLIFYIGFLGRHSVLFTAFVAIAVPVATFFFFEIALKITLPKGYTEPLFYPLYRIFL